jgi:trehalose/maltose hydrolase-like predicted phosphorylase
VHYPATYIAGCFNELRTEIAGRVSANESLVNAPNWLPLTFAAEDGPWLGEEAVTILSDFQELDLRRGVLTRRRRVSDSLGHVTGLTNRRFVHMGAAHLGSEEMKIIPENWSGLLRIRSELDGTVTNSGVPRYRGLACRHLDPVRTGRLGPTPWCWSWRPASPTSASPRRRGRGCSGMARTCPGATP